LSADDNFLARWSQRKRQAADVARKGEEQAPAEAAAPQAEPEEAFDLSLLPKIEDLTPETDISLFMQKGVPDALRNAALKRMWAIDPAIRDYVGDALDYAWDWNAPGGVPGGGDLGPGFDTGKMVAQIFGDESRDKNVIEPAAPQHDRAAGLPEAAENADPAISQTAVVSENAEDSCAPATPQAPRPEPAGDAAPRKKPRHGGAVPTRIT